MQKNVLISRRNKNRDTQNEEVRTEARIRTTSLNTDDPKLFDKILEFVEEHYKEVRGTFEMKLRNSCHG